MSQPFQKIDREGFECFKGGETLQNPQAGDFVLTHGSAWSSRIIQIGQMLRFHGKDKKFAYWNHAAIIINKDGDIIETLGKNVLRRNISVYKQTEYYVVHIKASEEDRRQAAHFAEYCLGEQYGALTVISIAISLLTGLKLSFGFDGQQICSGLVARALERTWAIFDEDASHLMPADLAKYYNVVPEVIQSQHSKVKGQNYPPTLKLGRVGKSKVKSINFGLNKI